MRRLAEDVSDALHSEFGEEPVFGVGYYDDEGVDHVHLSEELFEEYDSAKVEEILQEYRLEALGRSVYERLHEQNLRSTVRMYDELVDVCIPVTDLRGIALAVDVDADCCVQDVVQAAEHVIESAPNSPCS